MTAPHLSPKDKALLKTLLARVEPPEQSKRSTGQDAAVGAIPSDAPNEESHKRLRLVRASDVQVERVDWLWHHRLPRKKVTAFEGPMGVGKTTLTVAIAAAATTGSALPDQDTTSQGSAIIISLEDGIGDTLAPRLHAAGADLAGCHLFDGYEFGGEAVDGVFNIVQDAARLREAILDLAAVFVVIDPLVATLGDVNSYKDQDIRRALAPIKTLAEQTNTAIAFIRHLRKGGGSAEDAGGGSVGLGAACRSVLRVDRDPETSDLDRFLLSAVKASCSKSPTTLAYRIESVTLPGRVPIETSRICWDGESTWTARDLAAHAMASDERPRADEANEWLQDALSDGPRRAKELFQLAEQDGISKRTLQRAGDVLRVQKERKGLGEGSVWSLPAPIRANAPPFVPLKSMARMGESGTNGGLTPDAQAILAFAGGA